MQGTTKKVTWSSKNKKIATVNSSGKVKAIKVGNTTIVAKVGKKSYSCKVTVIPVFKIDEADIKEELSGRRFSINGNSFQAQEEEIGEVMILSKVRNKTNDLTQVIAEVEINRTIATMRSEVILLYQIKGSSWKLKSISENTEVETWNLEGIWKGSVEVYDYNRNSSEYRELRLNIYDVKSDGVFECEALFRNEIIDGINMSGEIDEETGELQIIGLSWIEDNSELAQDLSESGKIYSFYAVVDIVNDTFITDETVSIRKSYTSNMIIEKQLEEDSDDDWLEIGGDWSEVEDEEDNWYQEDNWYNEENEEWSEMEDYNADSEYEGWSEEFIEEDFMLQ